MPTIPEIKAELKTLGIKGTTGKNKAELMAMLESAKGSVPKRKRPQVAPVAAPEVPKRKRPQVAPVAAPEVPKRKRPQTAEQRYGPYTKFIEYTKSTPAPTPAPIVTKKEKEGTFDDRVKNFKAKQKELEKEILKIIPVNNDMFDDIMFDADNARILLLSGRNNEYYNLWLTISKKIKLYGRDHLTSSKTLELANKIKNYTEQVFKHENKLDFTWNPTEGKYSDNLVKLKLGGINVV